MIPQKLSSRDFIKSFELTPRLTVELVVLNSEGGVLLLKREKEPYTGMWHLPGGFLLKGERLEECTKRIALDELGIKLKTKGVFKGIFENLDGDPRGHILHYVVEVPALTITSGDFRFFKPLPENLIPYQKDFLQKLGYL